MQGDFDITSPVPTVETINSVTVRGIGAGHTIIDSGGLTIDDRISVITVNSADREGGGAHLEAGTGGTVMLKTTVIANNSDSEGNTTPDIIVGAGRTLDSQGYNRFTSAAGFTLHRTDYIGSVDYVVTSVADTYDGSADPINMSLRDAIHQANITAGTQEIWLPAWDFVLTRERTTSAGSIEMDISQGDLEITDSLTIRGITGATSVAWRQGAVADDVFELIGDYNNNGITNQQQADVNTADVVVWISQNGLMGSNLAADGNDDGVVNEADCDLWNSHFGNWLML